MQGQQAIELATHMLTEFAIILAIGSACGAIARKLSIPDIVLYLLAGMGLGAAGLGALDISADSAINQAILIFGACYLLFDGGASLRLQVLSRVWITIVVIATLGVIITGAVIAATAHYVMALPWIIALLLGAAIASTDPATLVPIFKQVPIRDRVAQTVMSESAFNDAMGAIATFAILGIAMGTGSFSAGGALTDLLYKAGVGSMIGFVIGIGYLWLMSPERIGLLEGYSSVKKVVGILAAYLVGEHTHSSGFMAVFVFGIMVGNRDFFKAPFSADDDHSFESFVGVFALMMRMFIFILLGSQVDFALMNEYLVGGVIVVTVMMLVARPLAVFICCVPDRRAKWTLQEMLFMCWTRETGVIPAALAGMLVGMNAPGAKVIAAVTFIAILMTIIIQATSTRWLAGKLGLLEGQGN